MNDEDLTRSLQQFFRLSRPALKDLNVSGLRRFFGGSSKPTYSIELSYWNDNGKTSERVVIRATPEVSLVDHSDDNEAKILVILGQRGFLVPRVEEVVSDPTVIGMPFFVMEEIGGCESAPHLVTTTPYVAHRQAIGEAKWRLLGTLAGYTPDGAECSAFPRTSVSETWRVELDKWEGYYRRHMQEPEPLVDHALRWLRRNPPPAAAKLSFVHGDYRTGNFLYDGEGSIRAILDWEMAHIGDPHEDIAWAICPSWGWPDADRPGSLITKVEAFAIWEEASGLVINPQALHWWSLFVTVKGLALWAACADKQNNSGSQNSLEYAACWFPRDIHLRLMAELSLTRQAYAA